MKISKIQIKNFRLLSDVELCLEDGATVIVGRNNSGKTSLTELFRRLIDKNAPKFKLEDFPLAVYDEFYSVYELYRQGEEEMEVREKLPYIQVTITLDYDDEEELGQLSNFIIDLDESCQSTKVNISYSLSPGKISVLFDGDHVDKTSLCKSLKEKIPTLYETVVEAEDPNDPENTKPIELSSLRSLLQFGFIDANRTLDDPSRKERAFLGRIFEKLFTAAESDSANEEDKTTAEHLKTAVEKIQEDINQNFSEQLTNFLPAFQLFGYPGLTDPNLQTETQLRVEELLTNHTSVGYQGINGINLPESYNGLGPRNLIFLLLKLYEFFKDFVSRQPASGVHLIFIEEPEAHLHPQMQSVFIRQIEEIRELFAKNYNNDNPWPVQFVVTTHSSHIANEASFDSIRYFLTKPREEKPQFLRTEIKDLRLGLSGEEEKNRTFLHKYMTLTKCDLLFADRAILIEGTTERLL
ncbi:MAG: ATP-binding protein, partial [Mameliella sp.]|nr:ATP-binding protein [Phaeodactylibacter sp.]